MPALPAHPDPFGADIQAALAAWQAAHPTATLEEIEHAVDQHLSGVRASLITITAATGERDERPACPACAARMHRAGQRSVRLTTAHEGQVDVRGHTYVCPACGTGLFPPR